VWIILGEDEKQLKLWDLNNGTQQLTLFGHSAGITSLAITADGRYALFGSTDKTLKWWD